MAKFISFLREFLFIMISMIIPIIFWAIYEYLKLFSKYGNSIRLNSELSELMDGFLIIIFFLILPATFLFLVLLKLFYRKEIFSDNKKKLLLAILSACSIITSLLIYNFTNVSEWFSFAPIPFCVFIFIIVISRREE